MEISQFECKSWILNGISQTLNENSQKKMKILQFWVQIPRVKILIPKFSSKISKF